MPLEIETPTTTPATKSGLIDLLYRLADDSLALGHRNSEWTGQAPILEEDIAFSSMAQDKIGHAHAFYTLLHDLGEPDPDALAYLRRPEQFHCCKLACLPRGDWAFSLIRHFYFAESDHAIYDALTQSSYDPLAKLTRKLRGEVKYHVMHGRSMIKHMGQGTPESRQRLQATLNSTFGLALGIFEPTKFDEALAAEGVCPTQAQLLERWRQEIGPVLKDAELSIPHQMTPEFGGRLGKHGPELTGLLDALQRVHKLDPTATW